MQGAGGWATRTKTLLGLGEDVSVAMRPFKIGTYLGEDVSVGTRALVKQRDSSNPILS